MKTIKKKRGTLIIISIIYILSILLNYNNFKKYLTLSSLVKIDNMNLYIMDYKYDYNFDLYLQEGAKDFDSLNKFLNDKVLDDCSAFATINNDLDKIVGRNLDLEGEHPSLLLKTNPKDGYASLSMVELTVLGYDNDYEVLHNEFKTLKGRMNLLKAPYMPRDGINEKGLVVATLNTSYNKVERDENKVSLIRWQVLRLLLDNAANVEECIELLKGYNSFDGSVHYFISDSNGKSIVAEYTNGEMKIVNFNTEYSVVTNFSLSDIGDGNGYYRYFVLENALKDKVGKITDNQAMRLLQEVSNKNTVYSTLYNKDDLSITIVLDREYNVFFKEQIKR